MNISSISSVHTIPVSNIVKAKISSNRIALPVPKGQLLYARFKHISGIPAKSGSRAYSVRRLRNLDNLIERMSILNENKSKLDDIDSSSKNAESKAIQQYAKEMIKFSLESNKQQSNIGMNSGQIVNILA